MRRGAITSLRDSEPSRIMRAATMPLSRPMPSTVVTGGTHSPHQTVLVIAVDRLAQPADMDVNRALIDFAVESPDRIDQLLA